MEQLPRQKYTKEFREQAVRLVREQDLTIPEAVRRRSLFHRCHRSAFWATDKPGRPICAMTIILQLHLTRDGVAVIA